MQPRYHYWLQSYSAQSKAPWFHSWYSPNSKTRRNTIPVIVHDCKLEIWIIEANGKRRVISTSKIKKMTATRKNRNENGRRAVPFGSNPHSKGEFFSRSEVVFFDNKEAIIITKLEINRMIVIPENKIMIVFSKNLLSPASWKPAILLY